MAVGDVALGAALNGGALNRDFLFLVAAGQVTGTALVYKFGANSAIGASEEDVCATSGVITLPTSAAVASVAYSGNDNSSSTGARKVMVEGLDSSFDTASEEVELTSGGSPQTTTQTFMRVFLAYVSEAGAYATAYSGSGGTNDNDITISVGGNVQVTIKADRGQTQTTHYTVPAGKTAYLLDAHATADATMSTDLRFYQRRDADDVTTPYTARRLITSIVAASGSVTRYFQYGVTFPEKTDLWWSGKTSAGSGTAEISYSLLLVDD